MNTITQNFFYPSDLSRFDRFSELKVRIIGDGVGEFVDYIATWPGVQLPELRGVTAFIGWKSPSAVVQPCRLGKLMGFDWDWESEPEHPWLPKTPPLHPPPIRESDLRIELEKLDILWQAHLGRKRLG